MIWQTINFNTLGQMLLPTFLRKLKIIAYLNSVFTPLNSVYEETLYKMQHNSQVIYLEKMLNEYFDVPGYDTQNHQATKTVYISDAPQSEVVYIYQTLENQPLYLDTVYLGAAVTIAYKFIVNIPEAYSFVEAKLRAIIDFYKLAGKRYIIQTY